jgi:hypothetical protein
LKVNASSGGVAPGHCDNHSFTLAEQDLTSWFMIFEHQTNRVQASNGWVSTDRSVLYVVTDGAASDGGVNGGPLAVQSELLFQTGFDIHVFGVGSRVRLYVTFIWSFSLCA